MSGCRANNIQEVDFAQQSFKIVQDTKKLLTSKQSFKQRFEELCAPSAEIKIAVGYADVSSVRRLLSQHGGRRVHLYIGLLLAEKKVETGYLWALTQLDASLVRVGGGVFLTVHPIHAKVYLFLPSNIFIVGSSNLNAISGSRSTEMDVELLDTGSIKEFFEAVALMSEPLSSAKGKLIEESNELIPSSKHVAKVTVPILVGVGVEIPLKASLTPKSNVNACFGKGRNRPWFEVEIGLGKYFKYSGLPLSRFWVVTPEGYRFECSCQGPSRWLRSVGDLEVLGQWLKGRLMQRSSFSQGDVFEDRHLEESGYKALRLTKTCELNTWFLEIV
jgi:hypothetical protein